MKTHFTLAIFFAVLFVSCTERDENLEGNWALVDMLESDGIMPVTGPTWRTDSFVCINDTPYRYSNGWSEVHWSEPIEVMAFDLYKPFEEKWQFSDNGSFTIKREGQVGSSYECIDGMVIGTSPDVLPEEFEYTGKWSTNEEQTLKLKVKKGAKENHDFTIKELSADSLVLRVEDARWLIFKKED